jgi:hypothetical protein
MTSVWRQLLLLSRGGDRLFSPEMSESTVRLPLRIPASLKAKLSALAEKEHRSLNKQIEFLLDRAVQEEPQLEDTAHKSPQRSKQK